MRECTVLEFFLNVNEIERLLTNAECEWHVRLEISHRTIIVFCLLVYAACFHRYLVSNKQQCKCIDVLMFHSITVFSRVVRL